MPVLYTRDEVAAILKVKKETISTWVKNGKLRASRIGGSRDIRISQEALQDFLRETEVRKNVDCGD